MGKFSNLHAKGSAHLLWHRLHSDLVLQLLFSTSQLDSDDNDYCPTNYIHVFLFSLVSFIVPMFSLTPPKLAPQCS